MESDAVDLDQSDRPFIRSSSAARSAWRIVPSRWVDRVTDAAEQQTARAIHAGQGEDRAEVIVGVISTR
jgi:hypothetical protein